MHQKMLELRRAYFDGNSEATTINGINLKNVVASFFANNLKYQNQYVFNGLISS